IFAVHERQVDEHALDREKELIVSPLYKRGGNLTSERVGGEGTRITAEHIARKLVKKDDKRQTRLGHFFPAHQLPFHSHLIVAGEAIPDFLVELGIVGEPKLVSFLIIRLVVPRLSEPKGENFFCL